MNIWDVYPGDSIQTVLDQASDGDKVFVHDNDGLESIYFENIRVEKKLKIQAEGKVIIKPFNPNYSCFYIVDSGSGSTIENFMILETNAVGIVLLNSNQCKIIGNSIINAYKGIRIRGSEKNQISQNYIVSSKVYQPDGILIENSRECEISENQVETVDGIEIHSSTQINISGNILKKGGRLILDASSHIKITNNKIEGANPAIRIFQGNNNRIYKNNILRATTGVILDFGECEIIDNRFNQCNKGIGLYYSKNVLVSENLFSNCQDAITLISSKNCIINSNKIQKNNYGIILKLNSDNIRILKNSISFNSYALDISDSNQNQIIENNIFSNQFGLSFTNSYAEIYFNRLVNDKQYEIEHRGTQHIEADDNWWGSNEDPALKINGNVKYNTWLVLSLIVDSESEIILSDIFTANIPYSLLPIPSRTVIFDLTTNSAGITTTQYCIPDGITMKFHFLYSSRPPLIKKIYSQLGQLKISINQPTSTSDRYKAQLDHQTIEGKIIR